MDIWTCFPTLDSFSMDLGDGKNRTAASESGILGKGGAALYDTGEEEIERYDFDRITLVRH